MSTPTHSNGPVVFLDAGCGTGKAIHDLREIWLAKQRPDLNVALLGFESDKMCPGHIVRKWLREVEWMIPGLAVKRWH